MITIERGKMKGYYRIDSSRGVKGLYELWESKKFGDEIACAVTLNGQEIDSTWDNLRDFIQEYEYGL